MSEGEKKETHTDFPGFFQTAGKDGQPTVGLNYSLLDKNDTIEPCSSTGQRCPEFGKQAPQEQNVAGTLLFLTC